ncbi:unnamed protein product [Blepharisma stoltei]|uniref:1-phosphatidylinositol-3-phosphate 5-kinase n=1 Tax=Blepharisma stoltei TaxID=1481888 RepID=A0AAU9JTZ3_9CILI|nr:unnamed protein product [Blepharisma stoltei]
MSIECTPLSQEFWMPDSSAKSCFKCDRPFTLFRRRHHCRFCGFIFCSSCSYRKAKLPSGFTVDRICEHCLSLFTPYPNLSHTTFSGAVEGSYISTTSVVIGDGPSQIEAAREIYDSSKLIQSEEFNSIEKVSEMLQEFQNRDIMFDSYTKEFLDARAKTLFKSHQIPEELHSKIIGFIVEIVNTICPSVRYRNDQQDINKYFRIVKFEWNDFSASEFVNGVVFKKNVAHKKMEKELINPRILFLQEASDFYARDRNIVSMDKLIDQEASYTKIFIKKLMKIKPNIVILGKGLPNAILNELSRLNITAFINVKPKIMVQLSRATKGKILDHVDQATRITNYIGTCGEFFPKTVGNKAYAFFKDPIDTSLVGSLLISGPDPSDLSKIGTVIRKLLLEYRNSVLEKQFFIQSGIKPIPDMALKFNDLFMNYTYLVTCGYNLCKKPAENSVNFYQENDKAIGDFLLSFIQQSERNCDSDCGSKLISHNFYFIKSMGRIKINFTKKLDSKSSTSNDICIEKECTACCKQGGKCILLSKSSWEYSFYKYLNNFFTNIDVIHKNACHHDFFKLGKFIFYSKGFKVYIQWEENPIYDLIPASSSKDLTRFYLNATRETFEELKTNGGDVLNDMLKSCSEMAERLNGEGILEETEKYAKWEPLKEEIEKIKEQIAASLVKLCELKPEDFQNFLEVETFRRNIFLQCCNIKVQIQNWSTNFKRLKVGSSLIITQSVVSESSGSSEENVKSVLTHSSTGYDEKRQTSNDETFFNQTRGRQVTLDDRDLFSTSPNSSIVAKPFDAISKEDEFLQTGHFTCLKSGNLTLPVGHGGVCVPAYEKNPLTIIAYALNSNKYYEEIIEPSKIYDGNITNTLEANLLSQEEQHFQIQASTYEDESFESIDKEEIRRLYGYHITFNITIFFAKQFQAMRTFLYGEHENFILSIARNLEKESSLGKSKASFTKSHNKKYIMKIVEEKEFHMFIDLVPTYFKHISKNLFHSQPSRIVRTIGAFKISIKNHTTNKNRTQWALLMENLEFNMPFDVYTYDLKGSSNSRRYVKEGQKRTKMDLNFLEDMKGIPITISKEAKKVFDEAVWKDTHFLFKQNVIDYSLLVIISHQQRKVAVGIIDYIEKYTLEKVIENKCKSVVQSKPPTITHPSSYKDRFRAQLTQSYFMSIEE